MAQSHPQQRVHLLATLYLALGALFVSVATQAQNKVLAAMIGQ